MRNLDDDKYRHLKDKIIFGTDWYLTLITRKNGGAYGDYCSTFKRFLDRIDKTLWVRFTLVNPWEFYGLGDERNFPRIKEGLRIGKSDPCKLKRQFDKSVILMRK